MNSITAGCTKRGFVSFVLSWLVGVLLAGVVWVPGAGAAPQGTTVFLANGHSAGDTALAAMLAASDSGDAVVLFASSQELTPYTSALLRDANPARVVLVGDEAALGQSVAAQVEALVPDAVVSRIEGADRHAAPAGAVKAGASVLFIANVASAGDVGIATAAAAASGGGVLLSRAGELSAPTRRVIAEWQPADLVLVGGVDVLGAELVDEMAVLSPAAVVSRLAGDGLVETAAAAALAVFGRPTTLQVASGESTPDVSAAVREVTTVVVANGSRPPDVSVAAALAASIDQATLVLSGADSLSAPSVRVIERLKPTWVVLVGGEAVLAPEVADQIRHIVPGVKISRLAGKDRYQTAVIAAARTLAADDGSGSGSATGSGSGSSGGSASRSATTASVPGVPAAPTVSRGAGSLSVSWAVPGDDGGSSVTGYKVQHCKQAAGGTGCDSGGWTAVTVTAPEAAAFLKEIAGLADDTTYLVQVAASNAVGDSGWSASRSATTASVPGVPAAPTVSRGAGSLSVSWAVPGDDGGSSVTGYKVQHCKQAAGGTGCDSGGWTAVTVTAPEAAAFLKEIAGLADDTTYLVQVAASNAVGDSGWSASRSATTASVPGVPAAPTVSRGAGSLSVSWAVPGDDGGSSVTGYKVQHCKQAAGGTGCDSGGWTAVTVTAPEAAAFLKEIAGLADDTTYLVQVAASNAVGDSGWSASRSATTASVPGVPAAPTVSRGAGSLSVSWAVPGDDGGSSVTGYKVQHCKQAAGGTGCDSGGWTAVTVTAPEAAAFLKEIAGLADDTTYLVQVAASNAVGDSGWSASRSATTASVPGVPAAPTVSRGAGSLSVSWAVPGDDGGSSVTGYKVQHCKQAAGGTGCDSGGWTAVTVTAPEAAAFLKEIAGLADDTTYLVQVAASNAVGDSGWSASRSATTFAKPGVPTQLGLPIDDLTITATWTAPTATGGSPITGYKLQYCVAGTGADGCDTNGWTLITTMGTGTDYTISGLAANTTYQVQVAATNIIGDSDWSPSSSAQTADVPSVLIRPAVVVSGLSFLVSWSVPSDDGGSDVTGYKVRHCVDSTGCASPDWTVSTLVGPDTSTTITGLLANTTYQVQVAATNNIGDSDWSLSTTQTTGTSLSGAAASVTVGWTAPADGAVAADN